MQIINEFWKREIEMEVSHTLTNLIILCWQFMSVTTWVDRDPALHTPLMAVTNTISAIIIVGAMLAAGLTEGALARLWARWPWP